MRVRVEVVPGARREKVEKVSSGVFAMSVREEAAGNAANNRVRALIARHFGVPPKAVRIIAGQRGRRKTLDVSVVS